MSKQGIAIACACAMLAAQSAMAHTPAADGCGGQAAAAYSHELEVMRAETVPLELPAAGAASPPRLELDRRYAISLAEQSRSTFRLAPGRATRGAKPRGGIFSFVTQSPGRYRVSLTSRHWVDVIDGAAALESVGHFGPGCALAHKIVEFDLPGGREMLLQLSGREDAIVGLAITFVAAPAGGLHGSH